MATTQGPKPAAQAAKPAAQAAKPVAQPLKQEPPKTVTNDTTTSTNPANAELQSQLPVSKDIGEKPTTVTEDNLGKIEDNKIEEFKSKLSDLFSEDSSELKAAKSIESTDSSLIQEALKELKQPFQPKVQMPSAGIIVTFFFAKEDGICTNNMIPSLPATVVLAERLMTNLAVFTLDSRDPVVLRKAIPHVSIAQKDSEGDPIRPFWDWPVINR